MATLRIGTSGWVYQHWRGIFYPTKLAGGQQLTYYAQHFDTVEVNYSFYRLPSHEVFARWRDQTPDGFLFAVKASRYLTHRKRLKEPAEPAHRLLEAAGGLEGKLGPILFQFPHDWAQNLVRLEGLLAVLPATHRYVFEFRHQSWLGADTYQLLERHHCALCIPDHPDLPKALRITANFTYIRFHSGHNGAEYESAELADWAKFIRDQLQGGIDVYAYFNNDVGGFAVQNAQQLRRLVDGA